LSPTNRTAQYYYFTTDKIGLVKGEK